MKTLSALLSSRCLVPLAAAVLLSGGAQAFAADALPTVVVQPHAVPLTRPAEAVIEAVRQSVIAAQVQGRVIEARVDAGARVKQGEVLMRIDAREASQAVAAATASVAQAQAGFINAKAQLDRARNLRAQNFYSQAALDQAQAGFDAARAQLRAAEAGQGQAQTGHSFTTITSPISGLVAQRHTEPGEMAQPGKPLFTVYDPQGLRAVADIPQYALAELGRGPLRAKVEFPESGRWIDAAGVVLLPGADPRTHTARARVMLPADAAGVVPGMAARVHFVVGETRKLTVPASAVLRRGEVTGVYVSDRKGGFVLRQVRLGETAGDGSIEVLAGLTGGESVALDPVRAGIAARTTTR